LRGCGDSTIQDHQQRTEHKNRVLEQLAFLHFMTPLCVCVDLSTHQPSNLIEYSAMSYPGSRTHIIRLQKPTSKPRKPTKKSLSLAKRNAEAGFAFLSEILTKLLYNAARHEDASFPSHQAAPWRQGKLIRRGANEWLGLSLAI
jgi:hypothetical protein